MATSCKLTLMQIWVLVPFMKYSLHYFFFNKNALCSWFDSLVFWCVPSCHLEPLRWCCVIKTPSLWHLALTWSNPEWGLGQACFYHWDEMGLVGGIDAITASLLYLLGMLNPQCCLLKKFWSREVRQTPTYRGEHYSGDEEEKVIQKSSSLAGHSALTLRKRWTLVVREIGLLWGISTTWTLDHYTVWKPFLKEPLKHLYS